MHELALELPGLDCHEEEHPVQRRPEQPQAPEDMAGERAAAGQRSMADRQSTTDQSRLADHPAPWSREDLRQRLDRLPIWHPSSSDPPERRGADRARDLADRPGERPEPLTDAEHADRVRHIRDRLEWARDQRLSTDQQHLVDRKRGIWSPDRRDVHDSIVGDLYEAASDVPCEHRAIMAGGLGGAGKSTVLDKHAGIDRSQYLTINPDGIKEETARRGLIPELDGLSPMEASDLVHEESSHVAKLLAGRAMKDGKNIIWDITMSSTRSTEQRLGDLDRAGFSTRGIFVDIDIPEAKRRADARHRDGHEEYRAGIGFGGRYVPPEVIDAQADPEWGSRNRHTFEQVKHRFTDWAVYDNSVTGRDPVLVAAGLGGKREEER
jgi:predicted ABC-type ATPase